MRNLFAAAVTVLLVAACGARGPALGGSTSPGSSPLPTAPAGFAVTVTEKDQVAILRPGQRLLVVLHSAANMRQWSHPQSSDQAILAPVVDPAALAPLGVSVAAFQAVVPGAVQVTALSGPNCLAGQACPMYAILYSLRVTVTA